jgi:hypothetical protein
MTTTIDTPRPEPLKDLVAAVSATNGAVMGILTALVSGGLITIHTSNILNGLYGLIPGALAVLATILGAHALATVGREEVTPLSDPRNNAGQHLFPAPAPLETLASPPPPSSPLDLDPTTHPGFGPGSA